MMTKSDIIQAAFRIWGRGFYQNTSLTKLTRELGVRKPALYRHFPNKQALLDAMYACFFDECAAFIRDSYEQAAAAADTTQALFIINRTLAEYYGRHVEAFIFSLIQVYGNREQGLMLEQLRSRGIDLGVFLPETPDAASSPALIQLITAASTFWIAHFHKAARSLENPLTDTQIEALLPLIEGKISHGLGLDVKRAASLDYEALEQMVCGADFACAEDDPLHRAVAKVVAEAGPWNFSMDMAAQRSGLSKSGLYAHYTNRQDMLRRFFLVELERITAYAEAQMRKSAVPEERLYLVLIALANYFRSYPELLLTLDWLRTRRIEDLGMPERIRIYALFAETGLDALRPGESFESSADRLPQWILFMVLNTLMRYPPPSPPSSLEERFSAVPNRCFRELYRFLALGLRGCNQQGE
jgi:AcrR family transcriptional regulator